MYFSRYIRAGVISIISVGIFVSTSHGVLGATFEPTTCECQITCGLNATPPSPITPGQAIRKTGMGLSSESFLTILQGGIDESCQAYFPMSETEARRLVSDPDAMVAAGDAYTKYFNGTLNFWHLVLTSFTRAVGDTITSETCGFAGDSLSKDYSCRNRNGDFVPCLCLPDDPKTSCFIATPRVDVVCQPKNDRGLNQEEYNQNIAGIYQTENQIDTTCQCQLEWTGDAAQLCTPKQWNFHYSDRVQRSSLFAEINISTLCMGVSSLWEPAGLSDTTIIESQSTCQGTTESISAPTVQDGATTGVLTGRVTCQENTFQPTVSAPPASSVGYEAIDFGFPTDKINALNKVGISGNGTTQMQLLLGRLIKYLVGFLGTLALCIVIYAGLQYMVAQGEAEKQHHALGMILWASIGIVALLGAYSIVSFVLQIL